MPAFHATYVPPKRDNKTEVSDGALTAFQNGGAELFSSLGFGEGGFEANADRMLMLDDTGKLVSAPPYDKEKDRDMAAAAQNALLFIMDKNYRLRQVRLESNGNGGFTFAVTDSLKAKQVSSDTREYFRKSYSLILSDAFKDLSKIWSDMKSHTLKVWSDMKQDFEDIRTGNFSFRRMLERDWGDLFGSRKEETKQAEVKVEAAPLIPEEETLQTEQPVSAPEAEDLEVNQIQQPAQPDMTEEKEKLLLSIPPVRQTDEQFLEYLDVLANRNSEENLNKVAYTVQDKNSTAEDYYDVVGWRLEAHVAKKMKSDLAAKTNPEEKKAFMDRQKKAMTGFTQNIRGYVKENSDQKAVEEYFEARANGANAKTMQEKERALFADCKQMMEHGINGYVQSVTKQNSTQQQKQQPQKTNQRTQLQQSQPQQNKQQQKGGL